MAALSSILDNLKPEYWPTAVIAMNDMMAMGCQAEARRRGIQMPEQLSITPSCTISRIRSLPIRKVSSVLFPPCRVPDDSIR